MTMTCGGITQSAAVDEVFKNNLYLKGKGQQLCWSESLRTRWASNFTFEPYISGFTLSGN